MITTARRIHRTMQQESGKVLIMALLLLVMGSLILTPLLGLMSTGLVAGQVYEKKAAGIYAADAGVEYGIWHLMNGGGTEHNLYITVNSKDVEVELYEFARECNEMATYEITSTASDEDGSSITVVAHVTNITVFYKGDKSLSAGEYIGGHVYVEDTLTLNADAAVAGDVIAGGDVILNAGALVGGVVCVGGNLELNNEASIEADVYVQGYVKLTGSSSIMGKVHSMEYVTLDGMFVTVDGDVYSVGNVIVGGRDASMKGNVYTGGSVSVGGQNAKIEGDVCAVGSVAGNIIGKVCEYCDCTGYDDWECPLGGTVPEILLWLIV